MKQYVIMLSIVAVAVGCKQTGHGKQLPGTYTRTAADQFGELWQSLEIKKTTGENTFHVMQLSRIKKRKLDDTAWLPEKITKVNYTGTYEPSENTLLLQEDGIRYSFDANKGTLGNGEVTFTRQ